MARVRTLTARELTVSLLARQLLLQRRPMPVAAAVRRLTALQAQYSPSPHVALHSRLDGFTPGALHAALRRGTVVKATLMRGTLHLVHAADLPAFAAAWAPAAAMTVPADLRSPGADVLAALRSFLAEPRTTDEIRDHVDTLVGGRVAGHDPLNVARSLLPLVHVPPSGFFAQHGKFSLRLADVEPVPEPAATAALVRSYLAAYGPATREDVAHFTYLRLGRLDAAIATLDVRRLTDADGRDLLDVPRGTLPREDVATSTRLLARWDAALLSHRVRARILPPAIEPVVRIVRNGDLLPTYVVDGHVAGSWSHEVTKRSAELVLQPLTTAAPPPDLEREAARMLDLLAPGVPAAARTITLAEPRPVE